MERLTVPKLLIPSGELAKRVNPYLEEVGITSVRSNARSLQANTNRGMTLVEVRPSDIPAILRLGLPDVLGGIAGSDSFLEETDTLYPGVEVPVYRSDERPPRIALAATQTFIQENDQASLADLSGKTVTTTLPNMTKSVFERVNIRTVMFAETLQGDEDTVTIFSVGGKTEAIPLLSDQCPAIVDVVDSGETLEANGLEVIQDIHEVSVRLVVASGISEENLEIFTYLEAMLQGVTV